MAARKDAARPRRPRAAAPRPLTEAQLDEVRRAVLAMSGTGARSLSKHGIVVYFDKELTLPKPSCQVRPVPMPAQEGAPSAAATRPDGVPSTSRQRRSWRRLQERLEQRAAAQVQERPTPPPAGDDGLAAMRAALLRTQSAAEEPLAPNLPSPDPKTPDGPRCRAVRAREGQNSLRSGRRRRSTASLPQQSSRRAERAWLRAAWVTRGRRRC